MKKLISYEYRNNKKDFNRLLLILIAVSTIFQLNGFVGFFGAATTYEAKNTFLSYLFPILVMLAFTGVFISIIVIVIYNIKLANILKKDIYEDQAYIIFSLPVSGKQIILSKYIVGVFYSLFMPIILVGYNILLFLGLFTIFNLGNADLWNQIGIAIENIFSSDGFYIFRNMFSIWNIIIYILSSVVGATFIISVIYASVVTDWKLSKVKKNSSMWIFYAIGFLFIFGLVENFLGWVISNTNIISLYAYNMSRISANISFNYGVIALIDILVKVIIAIALYFYTVHIFSNKIEI